MALETKLLSLVWEAPCTATNEVAPTSKTLGQSILNCVSFCSMNLITAGLHAMTPGDPNRCVLYSPIPSPYLNISTNLSFQNNIVRIYYDPHKPSSQHLEVSGELVS